MNPKKVLITGGTGFVGRHVQEVLKQRNIDHVVFSQTEYDLTDKQQADAVFEQHADSDTVLHLASYQAAGDFPAKHPAQQFYINNLIHTNTLEAWRTFVPHARFIAIGTSCAYPSNGPLREERFLDGPIHGSVYAYAFTKRLLYQGVMAYNDQYNLNGSYLIPATMFGEFDDFHVDTAHVCGALIGKFVRAEIEKQKEVEIWGDGTQVREFMDVKDFAATLLHLLPRVNRDVVNVGPGKGTSIRDLALMIAQGAEFKQELRFLRDKYVGIKEKFMVADKLQHQYKLHIDNDLLKGIARTVKWYRDHYLIIKDKRKFDPEATRLVA